MHLPFILCTFLGRGRVPEGPLKKTQYFRPLVQKNTYSVVPGITSSLIEGRTPFPHFQ